MQNIFNILTSSSCLSSIGEKPGGENGGGGGQRSREGEGGVDFRATGRLRGVIMSARGCLGCKLLPARDSCKGKGRGMEKGWVVGGEGSRGCRRKCPLSWVMFDAALLLPTLGKASGNAASEEAMRGSC